MTNFQMQFIDWIKGFSPETYRDVIAEIGAITDTPEGYKSFLYSVARNGAKHFRGSKEDLSNFNTNINLINRGNQPNMYVRAQPKPTSNNQTDIYFQKQTPSNQQLALEKPINPMIWIGLAAAAIGLFFIVRKS